MRRLFLFFSLLSLAGCAAPLTEAARNIKDADSQMVQNCQFLGDIYSSSGWYGVFATTGMENAKKEALENAASFKATHVVWSPFPGGISSIANGKAYRCSN